MTYPIIGMSPGNSYFRDAEMRFVLKEVTKIYGRAAILVADVPAISTWRALGYPENRGMPTLYDFPNEAYARSKFFENLPSHRTFWPPIQRPETWFETIFGPSPKIEAILQQK